MTIVRIIDDLRKTIEYNYVLSLCEECSQHVVAAAYGLQELAEAKHS